MYNIIFMGTPDFAKTALKRLVDDGHNIISVFTQEPKPVGRKQVLQKSSVHKFAEENSIPVFTPKKLKSEEIQQLIKRQAPDVIVVAAYGFIIPQAILDIPTYGCINIHASLLPRWRGAAPIQRAIMAGYSKTGITIMRIDAGMDTGDMLLKRSVDITPNTSYGDLLSQLSVIGAEAISEVLCNLQSYLLAAERQPKEGVTIASKITPDLEEIKWDLSNTQINNLVRALSPIPATWTEIDGLRIKVISAELSNQESFSDVPAGTILDKQFHVRCGDNTVLHLKTIQPAGKKIMSAIDFLNGHKNLIGRCFNAKKD